MATVSFKKGLLAALPSAYTEGAFYVTTDERALYLDVDGSTRIRIGDFQEFANLEALQANTNPSTTALYYIADINVLAKWNGTNYIQINLDTGATSIEVTGDGNAVTVAAYDAGSRKITLTKGATYVTSAEVSSAISAAIGDLGNNDESVPYATVKEYVDDKVADIVAGSIEGLGALAAKDQVAEADLESALAAKINGKADQTTVDTLVGADTGKSVRTIANEELAAQLIPEGAQESLDTLTEIAQWIQDHPDDAAAMNTAIAKLNGIVAGIGGEDDDYVTVMAAIEGKIAAAMESISAGATKVEASEINGNIKIDGEETTVYTHPTTTAVAAGFKKVGNDDKGHVVLGADVTKQDIVALGIPAQDTTYQPATTEANGLMSKEDKTKLDGIEVATDPEVKSMLDEVFGASDEETT